MSLIVYSMSIFSQVALLRPGYRLIELFPDGTLKAEVNYVGIFETHAKGYNNYKLLIFLNFFRVVFSLLKIIYENKSANKLFIC